MRYHLASLIGIFIALFLKGTIAYSQIYVTSNIDYNCTWEYQYSPYIIWPTNPNVAITILSGATLTIEEGVQVLFYDAQQHQYSLIVADGGHLIADGVYFMAYTDPSAGYDYWNGIRFEDGSGGSIINSVITHSNMGIEVYCQDEIPVISNNILGYCEKGLYFNGCNDMTEAHWIRNNEIQHSLWKSIECINSQVTFSENLIYRQDAIEGTPSYGYYLEESDVTIIGKNDPENPDFDIYSDGIHRIEHGIYCYNCEPTIRQMSFRQYYGSYINMWNTITTKGTTGTFSPNITQNHFRGVIKISVCENSRPLITDNDFQLGENGIVTSYQLFWITIEEGNGSAIIRNNIFWQPTGAIWNESNSSTPTRIENNIFMSIDDDNTYSTNYIYCCIYLHENAKSEIFNNLFYQIDYEYPEPAYSNIYGYCIFINDDSPSTDFTIYNNIFTGNCVGAIRVPNSTATTFAVNNNNYYDLGSGVKYYWVDTNHAVHEITTINEPGILTSDPNLAYINEEDVFDCDFHLTYTSSCINTGYDDEDFNDPDGTVNDVGAYGGPNSLTPHYVLIPSDASDFDLTLPQATYKVEGDIMVDGTLTISPGANLQFVEAVGIIVDENYRLNCSGEEGNIITLQSYLGEGAWDGIRLETASSVLTEIEYTDIDNCVTCLRIDNTTLNQAVNNCSFTNSSSGVQVFNASTDVDECTFSNCNTAIFMNNSNSEIDSNDIEVDTDGIYIYGGSTFIIQGNTFTAGDNPEVGISIYNGSGQLIGNSFLEGIGEGLIFYNSAPKMKDNLIDNCSYCGMQLSGGSQPIMNFATFDAANRIANCGAEEIYISGYLFPLIRTGYNDLIDEDNPNDYIISANFTGDPEYIYDVRENYWLEATPEDARDRIYPSNEGYENFRIVCTSVCESSNTGYISTLDLDELLSQAFELEMNNQYSEAYDIYESIVASYSNDLAAVTAFSRMFYCYRALELNLQELLDFYDQVEESIEQYINMFYLKRIQAQTMRAMEDYNSALELLYDLTEFAQGATDSIFVLMDIESNLFEMGAGGGGIQSANSSDYSNPEAAWTNFAEKMKEFSSSLEDLSSNGDQALLQVPVEYGLLHLYPNPFNCNATIQYKVPELSNVIISIYTITGEKVCDLEKGINYAGEFKRTWLAENIASGVYFVNIDIDPLTGGKKLKEVSKLLLVK